MLIEPISAKPKKVRPWTEQNAEATDGVLMGIVSLCLNVVHQKMVFVIILGLEVIQNYSVKIFRNFSKIKGDMHYHDFLRIFPCQAGVLGVHGEIVHVRVAQELVFELDNVITRGPRMEEHHV